MRLFDFTSDTDGVQTTKCTREYPEDEEELQSWLQQSPSLILDEPILVIGREVNSGNGKIDLLAVDKWGNTVVIEIKQGDTGSESTDEDKIIGQPQRYAAAIKRWDYQQLDEAYHDYQKEIASGKWDSNGSTPVDDLKNALERRFGGIPNQFNHHQRMVILAEHVTWKTAQTTRHLQGKPGRGPYIQCVEVQQFTSPRNDSYSLLATSLVVDYASSKVRPPRHTKPVYADTNLRIADRAFESISKTVNADNPGEVFSSGFGEREPSLISNNPEHPESVTYTLRVKPDEEPGHVGITLDLKDAGDSVLEALRNKSHIFEEQGYVFHQDNSNYRIVEQQWKPVEDIRELSHDGLSDEIAERYATLVQTGHEVLIEDYGQT